MYEKSFAIGIYRIYVPGAALTTSLRYPDAKCKFDVFLGGYGGWQVVLF